MRSLSRKRAVVPRRPNVPEFQSGYWCWVLHRTLVYAARLAGVVGHGGKNRDDDTRHWSSLVPTSRAAGCRSSEHHIGSELYGLMHVFIKRCIAVAGVARTVGAEAIFRPGYVNQGNASVHDGFSERAAKFQFHASIVLPMACWFPSGMNLNSVLGGVAW